MTYLLDKDFLKDLDEFRNREVYARITALSNAELPLERIEGKITGGSINIDGASAIRRTCSLSMVAEDVNINEFYWGLYNKFKLEIGLKNMVKETWGDKYPDDIIWFKQGIYVITSFNTSLTTSNYTISISGKDKMCLLNGEVGGSLPASIDFGKEEYVDLENETITYTQIPIKKILKESLHAYALEPYHNIIINDLDESGLELLEYRGDTPAYLFYDIEASEYTNISFNGSQKFTKVLKDVNDNWTIEDGTVTLEAIPNYKMRIDSLENINTETHIRVKANDEKYYTYTIAKLEYGQTAGYKITDLVYSGDLIANIGESLTSVYDKIVNMLGDFEYFYDIDGRFIFQRKKTYVNTSWNNLITTEGDTYAENSELASEFVYSFNDNSLISSFSNNPNLNNLRNDYSIWGARKGISGAEIPIHYRYAIHKKPDRYKPLRPVYEEYYWEEDGVEKIKKRYGDKKYLEAWGKSRKARSGEQEYIELVSEDGRRYRSYPFRDNFEFTTDEYDWREILYQMALDYYKQDEKGILIDAGDSNMKYLPFQLALSQKNPQYPDGYTGYEQFYSDIQGFWRELYDPEPAAEYIEYEPVMGDTKPVYTKTYLKEYTKSDNENNIQLYFINEAGVLVSYLEKENLSALDPKGNGFNEKGEQNPPRWYIPNFLSGHKPVTRQMINNKQINRSELYYSEDGKKFTHISDKVLQVKNHATFYTIEEFDEYISVEDWPSTYSIEEEPYLFGDKTITETPIQYYTETKEFIDDDNSQYLYWNKMVEEAPDLLNFWIDFLDSSELKVDSNGNTFTEGSELDKFSIGAIGDRPKVINDKDVKSIYYKDIPNLIFTTQDQLSALDLKSKTGYTFMYMPNVEDASNTYYYAYFTISAQGKSAKDKLDSLLYDHSYCTESITISAVPIYYLEPNNKIRVKDEKSKIDGDYVVSKISLPLAYNGTMSITATKAPQRIY